MRILPEINDEFAKSFGAPDLEKLKEGIRADLSREIKYKQNQAIRGEILKNLDERVQFDLPDSVVEMQTRNNVYEIVGENQRRGVDEATIDEHKNEIFSHASGTAKNKVKMGFILGKIAEKENIRATDEDLTRYVLATASQYKMKPEKLVKQIQNEGSANDIRNQIILSKTLDWLQLNAKIEETSTAPAAS
jgi:trigger factor